MKREWEVAGAFASMIAGNYVLQPVRDAQVRFVGKDWSAWLLMACTVLSLLVSPLGQLLVKERLRGTAESVQKLFRVLAVLLLLGAAVPIQSEEASREKSDALVAFVCGFYVLSQTINLLAISVLWSLSSDLVTHGESLKISVKHNSLFGAACTIGQGAGSVLASICLHFGLNVNFLLPIVAVLLETAGRFVVRASEGIEYDADEKIGEDRKPQMTFLELVHLLIVDPFIAMLCLYTFAYTSTMSLIYLERSHAVAEAKLSLEEVAKLSAQLSFYSAVATFIIQVGFSSTDFAAFLGIRSALTALPLLTFLGFVFVHESKMGRLFTIMAFEFTRRVTSFAISKPVRESLYGVLPSSTKFAAKSIVDTFMYRFGMGIGALLSKFVSTRESEGDLLSTWMVHLFIFMFWMLASAELAGMHQIRRSESSHNKLE